ncbi:MAG: hypothetical protein ACYCSR_09270 [Thiomonas sp.]|uniref:Uncharacterized protein n=1 Tax=mine drainage metagenome TaxID=410659 RepID=E6PPV2_9ZZZZ
MRPASARVVADTRRDPLRHDVRLTPATFLVNNPRNIVKPMFVEPDFSALGRLTPHELATSA